ncbi:MAG: nicotinate phosphoribosyltransferase [Patescibacteria group bacterium]
MLTTRFIRKDEAIIQSLLDVDFYKFTMSHFIWKYYRDVEVTFGMKNRTSHVRLAEIIPEGALREQLNYVRDYLRFNLSEIFYMRGMDIYGKNMFSEDYLDFLKALAMSDYQLRVVDGQFDLRFTCLWPAVTFWETISLAIANELYYLEILKEETRFDRQAIYAEGIKRLHEKIKKLKEHPDLTFIEFGTRRRFGRVWQRDVVCALAEELPPTQFRGTSNTKLAFDLGLVPMGTNAHELQMVVGALAKDDAALLASTDKVLDQWWELYGYGLSIALPDTFGSDFFFQTFGEERAKKWKGVREDSRDPFVGGEQVIQYYQSLGIDPKTKLWLPSDGLDIQKIIALHNQFCNRIGLSFGWGTTLTNDLGLPTLSLVAKTIEANGRPCVKLSDNLAKAMGPKDEVERYKRVFGYTNTHTEECKV